MTRTETEKFITLLRSKQAEITGSLRGRDEIVIEKASDMIDEVQLMGERELAARSLDRDSKMLRQIRMALARVARGTYGVCMHCEEEILPRRLAAVPWAGYCIVCQEKIDKMEIEVDESTEMMAPAA